ncbi:hypothetical protein [Fulvivirga ligni]|uniref:hypothetical protein n=1 Tax=Fulvivirga ligni TaxID=2904246 RepID=UPI001F2C09F4|nr:hypothetical protein [Fulvivirga ligni]UII20360.1 hypothetical protein LVD16_21185 [Fulvivirga ligni]
MKNILTILFSIIFFASYATPTKILVRAKAKDAKFIGSSIGGAQVIIRNAATAEIMASGKTAGSTGNTSLIMKEPHERYKNISDAETAKFEATINIDEPVFLTVEVIAPFNQPQSAVHASTQVWLIPGKDIDGDGVVLEIPGFIINVLSPQTHESVQSAKATITANVVMMCGCPLSNGGLWDAEKMEVKAIVKKDGKMIDTVELQVKEKNNTFLADYKFAEDGSYEITVYAFDARTGNSGVGKVNFSISSSH